MITIRFIIIIIREYNSTYHLMGHLMLSGADQFGEIRLKRSNSTMKLRLEVAVCKTCTET